MGNGLRSLGYAMRSLRKAPTFTLATVLLVALGVGVVTTVFTVVDQVLLRPLPYPAAGRRAFHDIPLLRIRSRFMASVNPVRGRGRPAPPAPGNFPGGARSASTS